MYLPKWVVKYGIAAYVMAMAVVGMMYSSYLLPWYYTVAGLVSVTLFFLYGRNLSLRLAQPKFWQPKQFEKRIFTVAMVVRVAWMVFIYSLFMRHYGNAFGFENADANYYNELGCYVASLIDEGNWHFYERISKWSGHDDISDMGYGIYMGFVYFLTDNNIIILRLLKCLWSSLTVVLLYRLAFRNFGPNVARMAAIFCALWPNFWYYCGAHLKESEMVFLVVLFVEQTDQMLRSRQFTVWKIVPVLLIGATLFTFRTPLALVAILALLFTIVVSSARVVGWGKRIVVGILAVLLIGVSMGNRIEERSRELWKQAESGYQQGNMEWRSQRDKGNAFAKYAGSAVFAPMIFTLPFPTMTDAHAQQETQMLLNGGNMVKNIMSGFVIFSLFILLFTGEWRQHALPLAFLLGYLVVLTMSSFPHSERFHQPVMPFEWLFAAYGLSVALTRKKYKRWFGYWCILMFVAAIAWNWFKLAGRGFA